MKKIFILFLLSIQISVAQKNEFLDREFWKQNPTIELIDKKIDEGNNPTELNRFGFDAVVYALLENTNSNTIKHLLTIKGNSVNKLTHDGRTYIFWAVYKNNIEFVKHLISNGAKMGIIDDKGYNVINFAATTGQQNIKLYDLLLDNGAKLNEATPNGANALLLIAPNLKDLSFTKYFTDKGLKITDVDNLGNGIFNYAASKDNRKILNDLIKKGVSYRNLNKDNGNAMLFATKGSRKGYNTLDYFKYLENLGIQPNVTTKNGKTPLHNLAYRCKNIASFSYFISKDINVNSINKDGNTALINASYNNSISVIDLLLKHTKNINHQNKNGETALSYAVKGNTPKAIALLLKKGANIDVKDKNGNNLMYYLMKSYSSKDEDDFNQKIELLGSNGLNMLTAQENGNTLYHLAVTKSNLSLLKKIKAFKQNINAKNKNGYTALQKAVMTAKNTAIIKYLINEGANTKIITDFNETIFDLAKENEALKTQDLNFLKT